MKKFLPPKPGVLLLGILLLLYPLYTGAAAENKQFVTMHLPEAVITDAIKRVLPITFNDASSRLEGTITLLNITDLHFKDQQILCHLDLKGENLNLITQVANQNIRLKLGSTRIDFDCDARIRFDAAQKTLFIRPVAKNSQNSDALQRGDIGQALMLLLNGREFPIALQDLQPIIAEASGKIITIQTIVTGVRAVEGALQLYLSPVISTTPNGTSVSTTSKS